MQNMSTSKNFARWICMARRQSNACCNLNLIGAPLLPKRKQNQIRARKGDVFMATIQKRGNSYKITVSCGYDLTGKQIRRHKTFTPDKGMTEKQVEKAVQREAVLFEERCRRGQILDENIRFADFAEKWFTDYAEKQLRPKTLARYRSLMPRNNAAIGHIRLSKLQPHHLMAFYDNLAEAGVREDTKYHCKVDLKALLKARSMTKSALAGQSEVSLFVLNSITQNKNISKDSAQRISKALNLPCGELFDPVGKDETLSPKTILHHHRYCQLLCSGRSYFQIHAKGLSRRKWIKRNRTILMKPKPPTSWSFCRKRKYKTVQ